MSDELRRSMRRARCDTVDDCTREGFAVQIQCGGCGARRIVEAEPLQALCRVRVWPHRLAAIGNKMKCSRCGRRCPCLTATAMPPDSPPIGPTSEAEFKAMVRAMRR